MPNFTGSQITSVPPTISVGENQILSGTAGIAIFRWKFYDREIIVMGRGKTTIRAGGKTTISKFSCSQISGGKGGKTTISAENHSRFSGGKSGEGYMTGAPENKYSISGSSARNTCSISKISTMSS